MTTRAEHIEWCKRRARPYCEEGEWFNLNHAFSSMMSDIGKHPETAGHPGIKLGMLSMMAGGLKTREAMLEYINGFN